MFGILAGFMLGKILSDSIIDNVDCGFQPPICSSCKYKGVTGTSLTWVCNKGMDIEDRKCMSYIKE
ncbi:MAG: hypothetical protein ACRC92_02355 [Peptostreptococcaceae bacterium]